MGQSRSHDWLYYALYNSVWIVVNVQQKSGFPLPPRGVRGAQISLQTPGRSCFSFQEEVPDHRRSRESALVRHGGAWASPSTILFISNSALGAHRRISSTKLNEKLLSLPCWSRWSKNGLVLCNTLGLFFHAECHYARSHMGFYLILTRKLHRYKVPNFGRASIRFQSVQ